MSSSVARLKRIIVALPLFSAIASHLLLFLITVTLFILLLCSLSLLPPDTAWSPTTEWRSQREVDVLLAVQTNDKAGDVDDLLANTDVALLDEDAGVVDALGKTELVDTSLKATLQEIFDFQGKHVIELHAGFIEHTDTDETTNEGIAFKESLGVFLIKGEKFTGSPELERLRSHAQKNRILTERHDESWKE